MPGLAGWAGGLGWRCGSACELGCGKRAAFVCDPIPILLGSDTTSIPIPIPIPIGSRSRSYSDLMTYFDQTPIRLQSSFDSDSDSIPIRFRLKPDQIPTGTRFRLEPDSDWNPILVGVLLDYISIPILF